MKKKKILLIGDLPDWAFYNIISFVIKHFKKEYDIYYDYTIYNPRIINKQVNSDFQGNLKNTIVNDYSKFKSILFKIPVLRGIIYRLIKVLNLKGILQYDADGRKRRVSSDNRYNTVCFLDYYMDLDADFDYIKYKSKAKGIYTESFPPKGITHKNTPNLESFFMTYLSDAKVIVAGSPNIKDFYSNVSPVPVVFANMAYNEKVFKPLHHKNYNKEKLILGWTGNPKPAFKGFYDIIIPAVEKLKNKGINVELLTQFSGKLNSLVQFWNKVDICLIASEADAGPSMFMEASLCEVPSISTKIGWPAHVINDGVNGLFVNRNIDDFVEKVEIIYNNRELLQQFSNRIRSDYIANLGTNVQIKNWELFFQKLLDE